MYRISGIHESKKTRFELFTEFVRVVAWPLIVIAFIFCYKTQISKLMNELPEILTNAESVTIAGMAVKIDHSLEQQDLLPSKEVKDVLAKISPKGIMLVLNQPDAVTIHEGVVDVAISEFTDYKELIDLGLAKALSVEELKIYGVEGGYGLKITDLGKETRTFLSKLVYELANLLRE